MGCYDPDNLSPMTPGMTWLPQMATPASDFFPAFITAIQVMAEKSSSVICTPCYQGGAGERGWYMDTGGSLSPEGSVRCPYWLCSEA